MEQRRKTKSAVELNALCIVFEGDKHFDGGVFNVGDKLEDHITIVLEAKEEADVDTLPSKLTFLLKKHDQTIDRLAIRPEFQDWLQGFFDPRYANIQPIFNICMFGLTSTGKTSYVNSLLTSINNRIMKVQPTGVSDKSLTQVLKKIPLRSFNEETSTEGIPSRYVLWDIWGITRDSFETVQIERIVYGQHSDRTDIADVELHKPFPRDANLDSPNRKRCILFFFDTISFISSKSELENDKFFCYTRELMSCISRHCNVIVVLTKADNHSYQIGHSNPQFEERYINLAAEFFNLPHNQIFPLINYGNNEEKNFEQDRMIFSIFRRALMLAQNSIWETFV